MHHPYRYFFEYYRNIYYIYTHSICDRLSVNTVGYDYSFIRCFNSTNVAIVSTFIYFVPRRVSFIKQASDYSSKYGSSQSIHRIFTSKLNY
jgi:hypothetical protein